MKLGAVRAVETLAAARTITQQEVEDYSVLQFDAGGAGRAITMPTAANCTGLAVMLVNSSDGAEILTVDTSVASPTQNESALLFCNGSAWIALETTLHA